MRSLRHLALIFMAAAVLAPVQAAEHGRHIAVLVATQGLEAWDAAREDTEQPPDGPLLGDGSGRQNVAETNLNWAAALLEVGDRTDLAEEVVKAVLEHQDTADGSKTRGLFRWFADPAQPYSADATLYLAPALAHLATEGPGGELGETLKARAAMALQGLLTSDRPKGGFGAAMWAGAVASLAHAAGEPAGLDAAAGAVSAILNRFKREGLGSIHSPTYDALRIGGLRWALQFAADETGQTEAQTALRICYADMLQRYDPATAMVTGAIASAYPAEYLGNAGVAQYLLACDLPSALSQTREASPLAMYFALSEYTLPPELTAMAQGSATPVEIRTRTPIIGETGFPERQKTQQEDAEEQPPAQPSEAMSTCTWVGEGISLGTMSGPVEGSCIPIMATCDLPERPTTYLYAFGGPATLHSAQSGGLALCSFNFDGVGIGQRMQVGLRGMLGRRDQIDRVVIGRHDWIGEPEAVGQNTVVAVQRGGTYVGIKILTVGSQGEGTVSVKPAAVEWLREGNMDSLMLKIWARRAGYPLQKPMHDVRLGLLVEVARTAQFESLDAFAENLSKRRVSHETSQDRVRVDQIDESQQIPGRHEIKSIQEMKFLKFVYHRMALKDEALPLGITEELLRNRLMSRTLPVELPEDYLWSSPSLTLQRGGEPLIGPSLQLPTAPVEAAAEATDAPDG
ncbi:MAG: hypothetical protein GF393_06105 [Armatimonadia bacterium]|nr:hypothetical protein [Armatimonadia bacterium]